MTKQSVLIELESVTKVYEGSSKATSALRNVDLLIKEGEHLAIVGKSGSGKSTLLNMLTGIDHPTKGVVKINDTEIHTLNESELATWRGKNIGIVFQFFQLIPTLTIQENLLMAMDFVNVIPKKNRIERTNELLTLTGIIDHKHKLPSTLSGGEQQRAAIARALVNNPSIIIADEPTGNLDSQTTQGILDLFDELWRSGKTIIVVTHEAVGSNYQRIITMKDGCVVSDEDASIVLSK